MARELTYFFANGLVRHSVRIDTAKNQSTWSQSGAPRIAEIMAANAPIANHIDTSPGTMPSIISRTIIATSHTAVILNPPG